jgi:uncharacterized damage-inducible protein DinB
MSETEPLLERFRLCADRISAAVSGASAEQLDWEPAPGKWTIRRIVCHVADTELVAGDRIRRILAEDNPTLIPFDQDAWAERLDYHRRDIACTVEMFRLLRKIHSEMLAALPEEAWNRSGIHTERGRVTLADTVRTHSRHVESHARQIDAIRRAFAEAKGQ